MPKNTVEFFPRSLPSHQWKLAEEFDALKRSPCMANRQSIRDRIALIAAASNGFTHQMLIVRTEDGRLAGYAVIYYGPKGRGPTAKVTEIYIKNNLWNPALHARICKMLYYRALKRDIRRLTVKGEAAHASLYKKVGFTQQKPTKFVRTAKGSP